MTINVSSQVGKINPEKDVRISSLSEGTADWVFWCHDHTDLRAALSWARERNFPVTVLGSTSNSVPSPKGIRGLVILTGHCRHCHANGELFEVRAGLPLSQAVDLSVDAGLSGLEMLAGIPGTVGGAVYSNAASAGATIADSLYYVDWMSSDGEMHRFRVREDDFGWRSSPFMEMPGAIIYECAFRLTPAKQTGTMRTIAEHAREKARQRRSLDRPLLCRLFRDQRGSDAETLARSAHIEGMSRGGAAVSRKNPLFLVSTGYADPKDIRTLAYEAQETVKRETGILLPLEVEFPGSWD